MRDAIVLAIVLGAAPICLVRPYVGVLMWFWITLLNPRGYVYGLAAELPLAVIIAVPTLIGVLFADTNRRFLPKQMVWFFAFWTWMVVTYLHCRMDPVLGDHQMESWRQLLDVSKMLLMTFVAVLLVTSKERLRYLFLLTAACLGILAVKGAIWGILTGGASRVYGTQRSFLADNNDFALALNMTLPISFFLARQETNRKLRFVLWTFFVGSIISVILTYSRGGLAALAVVLAVLSIKAQRKLLAVFLAGIFAFGLLTFTPEHWQERMSDTFIHGQIDDSAQDRLAVWQYAWNLAQAYPVTGGGFECFTPALFAKYEDRPFPSDQYAALGPHSIYFQVLAEHGFVGLFLFFALLVSTLWTTVRMKRVAGQYPGMEWMKTYCDIVQAGIFAFLIGGAFLGRAYSDLYFELIACALILQILYRRAVMTEVWEESVTTTPELVPA